MAKKCLVLMPFSDPDGSNPQHWKSFYWSLSRRILATLADYECEQFNIGAGVILPNLMVEIVGSDLIICDLTHFKPNVLFELGASLVLGKPTILLARGMSPLPSDISNYAFVKYTFDEQEGILSFSSNGERDLFEKSLEFMSTRYTSESIINTDTNLAKILKAISNTLKHAIQLESGNAILAPALKSLFDNLVSENATELGDFIENNRMCVTVRIESPRILFNVLIALLNNLTREDKYDSITWKRHWIGGNQRDSERFLQAILKSGENLPSMRRVFLVGINGLDRNGLWCVDEEDRLAVEMYYRAIGTMAHKVHNRVLFLPQRLIDPLARLCHMGRITKCESVIYVFSQYSESGSLESFRLVREGSFNWEYEDFWNLSVTMEEFDWSTSPLAVHSKFARFFGPADNIRYRVPLKKLLNRLGMPQTRKLTG